MPWTFVHAPLHLNLFLSNLHTISAASMFVWFCYTYWLVFIFCGMKDVWAFGLMFPAFYPFLDWALLRQRPSFFSRPHVFLSCVYPLLRLWAYWLLILSYHFIMSAITLPSFLLRVTPWTCSLVFLLCQPTSSSISCSGLPRPIFHIFTSFGLYWPTFLLCQPIFHSSSFFGPFTSSLPLLLPLTFC